MQLRDHSFLKPQDNLAYDDVLLTLADKHEKGEFLRFWESSQIFVVLGRIGKEDADVNLIETNKDQIPVLHRSSGGGTVVQGPGCLNYSLILSKQKHPQLNDLRQSYQWISQFLVDVLRPQGIEAIFKPISDLATGLDEKKFSGNAQRRAKHYILHHGTILYNFDLGLVSHYLKMPTDKPQYRKDRSHKDFVTNISIDPAVFKKNLAQALGAGPLQAPSAEELSLLK